MGYGLRLFVLLDANPSVRDSAQGFLELTHSSGRTRAGCRGLWIRKSRLEHGYQIRPPMRNPGEHCARKHHV